jgi:hypothetical protein
VHEESKQHLKGSPHDDLISSFDEVTSSANSPHSHMATLQAGYASPGWDAKLHPRHLDLLSGRFGAEPGCVVTQGARPSRPRLLNRMRGSRKGRSYLTVARTYSYSASLPLARGATLFDIVDRNVIWPSARCLAANTPSRPPRPLASWVRFREDRPHPKSAAGSAGSQKCVCLNVVFCLRPSLTCHRRALIPSLSRETRRSRRRLPKGWNAGSSPAMTLRRRRVCVPAGHGVHRSV